MLTFTHSIRSDLRITFNEKPGEAIRSMLKAAGFRWSPSAGCWWRRGCKGAADFLAALDRKLNPNRPDGACWDCKSPTGFFRPYGTATPVYCDACHAARRYWEALPREEREHWERLSQTTELPAFRLAYTNRPQAPDRFDLDYEDRCREACGL